MVFWDGNDCFKEAEEQLSDKTVCKEVKFDKNLMKAHTKTNNKMFKNLKYRGFKTDKELKCSAFDHKRACKLY